MSPTLLSLGAALLGTAILTTGLFLLVSGQRRGRQVGGRRAMTHTLLGGALVAGGAAIGAAAIYLWPYSETDRFDPDAVLRQAPPAALPPPGTLLPEARFRGRDWLVVSWGTPNDLDQAAADDEALYSGQLAELARQVLGGRVGPDGAIATLTLARAEVEALHADPAARRELCAAHPQASIVSMLVESSRAADEPDSYLPWREPEYQVLDCRDDELRTHTGRVVERRGDTFPYQQALAEDLAHALDGMLAVPPEPGA